MIRPNSHHKEVHSMKRAARICIFSLFFVVLLASCATKPVVPQKAETYEFDSGEVASITVDGVTITAKYVATDSWKRFFADSDLEAMLGIPQDKLEAQMKRDNVYQYWMQDMFFYNNKKYYFFPISAGLNTFKISITNNTKGTIQMRDLRAGFITPDGERFTSLDKQGTFDFMNNAAEAEIIKHRTKLIPTVTPWKVYMNIYNGLAMTKYGMNKKFKVINDPDSFILPGETFKGFAFFDGGVAYDSVSNKVTYLEKGTLGIFEVPVQVDQANTILKKGEFIFKVQKVTRDI